MNRGRGTERKGEEESEREKGEVNE
jgi:hypothetical protein